MKEIQSSVSIIERTLYKLMLDFSEHVQVTVLLLFSTQLAVVLTSNSVLEHVSVLLFRFCVSYVTAN